MAQRLIEFRGEWYAPLNRVCSIDQILKGRLRIVAGHVAKRLRLEVERPDPVGAGHQHEGQLIAFSSVDVFASPA